MDRYSFSKEQQELMEVSKIPLAVYQFIGKKILTITLSAGFCELFGYADLSEAYQAMNTDMFRDVHADDVARLDDSLSRFANEGGKYDVIYRRLNKKKTGYIIVHAKGEHTYAENGARLAYVWYMNEGRYTEEQNKNERALTRSLNNALFEESFIKSSYYDHLTGLPSMTYFFELAAAKREEIKKKGGRPVLLFIDLSGMKYFNHKYGFSEGDKLLQCMAGILAVHFGNDCCSRLWQDHFAVITEGSEIENELESLFSKCRAINGGRTLPLHVGIYQHWYDGIAASMACDRAKFACDTLKNNTSSYCFYNMDMKAQEEKQQYILTNLDKAISEGWIQAYYQPIVRTVNGRVCDEEALARWIDPARGMLSPGDFIPILEDHHLIYKLDLYMIDCILEKINIMKDAGLHLMPQSVNLSRSDFDSCDIVEEIRRRVDKAGIDRSLITVEITESMIGQDFDFMKSQIDRFRELGFAVWMDDFGSGYSSLDVLQSIQFDLIKFDMRFMQQFNEGSRIILTELLKMATALGIDTVCEGVETAEQVQFLQETGCTKLQGYYFDKPIPVEKILEKYAKGIQIGFEDPEQSRYYDAIGRINLQDLSVISQGDIAGGLNNYFNSLPMAVIEIDPENVRFIRSNQSYRDFMTRYFNFSMNDKRGPAKDSDFTANSPFIKALINASENDNVIFTNEKLLGEYTVHSCVRRIAVNPKNGMTAVAVAVLSITKSDIGTTYANIARALAADYFNLYYVNLVNDKFIEYSSYSGGEDIAFERHGSDFFEESRKDAMKMIFEEDRDSFISTFTKENILSELDRHGIFTLNYRLIKDGHPVHVSMKAMRMQQDPTHIIIGVNNDDSCKKNEN